jgi:Mg-chelatase subunit ChlD
MDHITFISDWNEELKRAIGTLEAQRGATKVSLPLANVDIQAKVAGRVAEVTITQSFRNPYPEHLEAVYTFPLAGNASVSSFKMQVGSRTVIGTVQERRAAREQYAKALSEGKRAALLEQERDDVFTMQVGNITSGEDVQVILTYTEKLQFFENGTTELRLPLVVAPRYIPGNAVAREQVGDGVEHDTDEVPDASRISPPRLAAGLDSCVSLNLCVELSQCVNQLSDTGRESSQLQIADLSCSQHAVKTSTTSDCVQIKLAREDELLNRDFVLRWRMTAAKISTSLVFNQEKDGERSVSYGMLSVLPPVYDEVGRPPRDVVFIIDRSGSMEGTKMTSAARACSILLKTLGPDDRYAICAFDTVSEWLQKTGQSFFNADEAGIESGIRYLKNLFARGGTELLPALTDATKVLKSRTGQTRMPVIVILTDGDVGNESSLFKFVQKELGETRIFTVGIDTAVNFGLLDRLSKMAGGTSILLLRGRNWKTRWLALEEKLVAR